MHDKARAHERIIVIVFGINIVPNRASDNKRSELKQKALTL